MNAQPKFVRYYCAACWAPFMVPVALHGKHLCCEKCRTLTAAELAALPTPVTGIAIKRQCLCCHEPFLARDEAALYCGPHCYARANCHRKVIGNPKRR